MRCKSFWQVPWARIPIELACLFNSSALSSDLIIVGTPGLKFGHFDEFDFTHSVEWYDWRQSES